MGEKKNLTPNAIEDDKLDEVAGGRTFNFAEMADSAGIGDHLKKTGKPSKKFLDEHKYKNEQP